MALLSCAGLAFGQVGTVKNLGRATEFSKSIANVSPLSTDKHDIGANFSLPTPAGENLAGTVNLRTEENGKVEITGGAGKKGTFSLATDASGNVSGYYHSITERKAFEYSTDNSGNVIAKEIAIESLVCMDYERIPPSLFDEETLAKQAPRTTAIPSFESKPDSKYVIYIDLDGETIASKHWASGRTINAQPLANWTDAQVEIIWKLAAQDYLPFDVNVTTDRSVFNKADICKKKMCIVTKTLDAADGQAIGGIAWISSFDECTNDPCWVFNAGGKVTSETVSHEVGHTVGLNHDGTGSVGYYQGHNNWAPIMGAAYSTGSKKIDDPNVVGQWSKGEYSGANNKEDDLSIITTTNGFGYRDDDYGNTYTAAGDLTIEPDGKVLGEKNQGIISRTTDKDVLKFTIGAGDITLTAAPYYKTPNLDAYPNLNIQLRLLNSSGTELALESPSVTTNTYASMAATLTKTGLAAGTYYLEIDGVANGTGVTGYTDYASLGGFNISGTVPKAPTTGIDTETGAVSQFNIFPNPSDGAFNITFNANTKANYKLEVFNSVGQKVHEETLDNFSGAYSRPLDIQQYGKGIYLIGISNDDSKSVKRAVAY